MLVLYTVIILHTVAEFIDPWLRGKVNSGIGLSYLPASHAAWRAGTRVDFIPQSEIYEFGSWLHLRIRAAAKHYQTIVLSQWGGTVGHILRILDRVGPVVQNDVSRRHVAAAATAVHHVTVAVLTRRRRGPLHKQRPLLAALVIAAGGRGRYTGRRTAAVHWWIGAAAALVSSPRMAGPSEQPSRGHDLLFLWRMKWRYSSMV